MILAIASYLTACLFCLISFNNSPKASSVLKVYNNKITLKDNKGKIRKRTNRKTYYLNNDLRFLNLRTRVTKDRKQLINELLNVFVHVYIRY